MCAWINVFVLLFPFNCLFPSSQSSFCVTRIIIVHLLLHTTIAFEWSLFSKLFVPCTMQFPKRRGWLFSHSHHLSKKRRMVFFSLCYSRLNGTQSFLKLFFQKVVCFLLFFSAFSFYSLFNPLFFLLCCVWCCLLWMLLLVVLFFFCYSTFSSTLLLFLSFHWYDKFCIINLCTTSSYFEKDKVNQKRAQPNHFKEEWRMKNGE